MGVKVTNNGYATISAGITSTATTITLDSGQGARFPTLGAGDYFFGTLVDTSNNIEIVKVTARSTDSMTVVRGQDNTTARAYAIGDRFELRPTAALFESIPYDNPTTSTGSLALPVGTTAQAPSAASTKGHIRFDDDIDVVYYSDGVSWKKISSVLVQFNSLSGTIYAGASTTLTLTGTGFGSSITVNFTQSSDAINEDVSVTPASDTSATVTVPSAVYNNVTAGNVVTVTITNSDGNAGSQNSTAVGLPTGGTITNSGGYRYHTFTSSSNLVVPTGFTASADYLIVAGGGGGGSTYHGAGGGAGGAIDSTTTLSAQTYSITVGSGGSGGTAGSPGSRGSNGVNSSAFSQTAIGGGGGASYGDTSGGGKSGGSGGGGAQNNGTSIQHIGGAGTSGQGNAGGNTLSSGSWLGGGGGGGASAAGGNGSGSGGTPGGSVAGAGGNGINWKSLGTYYAGGGSGSYGTGGTSASPGLGGGGAGSNYIGGNGSTNTGGGGGGSERNDPSTLFVAGGNGGSGIVIVRYAI